MAYNETQPYNYPASQYSEFEKNGHPGKFNKVITCTTGTTTFTGSNFGVGAIIVPNGSAGTGSFSNGGVISLAALASNNPPVYEFSLSSVNVTSGTVYALVRNHLIR